MVFTNEWNKMTKAYYNEFDKNAAAWLRELIKANIIAPGEVDERSIEDVTPADLRGFTQCHFFAGIGVWSYALRQAGWPDDRQVWTGSCPCQPFSIAGQQKGTEDSRHLWPVFSRLIAECGPSVVFGEQVASAPGRTWLNSVRLDLEALGYGVGAADLCAAGAGAPHIRQRLYFVAERERPAAVGMGQDPNGLGWRGRCDGDSARDYWEVQTQGLCGTGLVAHAIEQGRQGRLSRRQDSGRESIDGHLGCGCSTVGLANTERDEQRCGRGTGCEDQAGHESGDESCGCGKTRGMDPGRRPNPTNGFWGNPDWLLCRDERFRPVKPGSFPLVARTTGGVGLGGDSGVQIDPDNTAEARVMRLKGYGNSIVAPLAQAFIESYLLTIQE